MTYIEKLTTNDEDEIVSRLCKIITGIYINDWKNDSYERFVEELTYVKNTIQSIKESEQSTEGENKISIKTVQSKDSLNLTVTTAQVISFRMQ